MSDPTDYVYPLPAIVLTVCTEQQAVFLQHGSHLMVLPEDAAAALSILDVLDEFFAAMEDLNDHGERHAPFTVLDGGKK